MVLNVLIFRLDIDFLKIIKITLDLCSLLWYCVVLTGGAVYGKHYKRALARQYRTAKDSRTNSKEMKELLGYMARHTHSEGILPSEQM